MVVLWLSGQVWIFLDISRQNTKIIYIFLIMRLFLDDIGFFMCIFNLLKLKCRYTKIVFKSVINCKNGLINLTERAFVNSYQKTGLKPGDCQVLSTTFYNDFLDCYEKNNIKYCSQKTFGSKMISNGFQKIRQNSGWYYLLDRQVYLMEFWKQHS